MNFSCYFILISTTGNTSALFNIIIVQTQLEKKYAIEHHLNLAKIPES